MHLLIEYYPDFKNYTFLWELPILQKQKHSKIRRECIAYPGENECVVHWMIPKERMLEIVCTNPDLLVNLDRSPRFELHQNVSDKFDHITNYVSKPIDIYVSLSFSFGQI